MKFFKIGIELEGISDIMFDKFIDHSKEIRPAEQKLYLTDNNAIVMPDENINAFLFNQKGGSCSAVFEGKRRADYIRIGESHTVISPQLIPFTDEKGKPIIFEGFGKKFYIHTSAPTTKLSGGGIIKQEAKPRPVLKMPWFLSFEIKLIENRLIDPPKLHNWFENGGILIALGTHRPKFGRFSVKKWEVK